MLVSIGHYINCHSGSDNCLMVLIVLEIKNRSMHYFLYFWWFALFLFLVIEKQKVLKMYNNAVDMKEEGGVYKIIDLDRTATMTSNQYTDLVKRSRYIPLKMGSIPIGAINDIFINDKYIIISRSQKSKSIFVYDWQGKVKCIISARDMVVGSILNRPPLR